MGLKLSDSELSKTIILTASAFAVSGVITAGAAHASDIGSEIGNNEMPGRTIAMSNLPGLSRHSANAAIDSSTASDTGKNEAGAESDAEDVSEKAKNFVSPDKRAAARKFFSQSMALKKQGDSGGALIGFLKASREDPTLLDAYYEQAIIFREKGFHKLAASRLEQALAIKPKFQKARLLLATVKLEQGNVPDAMQELGKTLGLEDGKRKSNEKPQTLKDDEPLPPPMILQALHPAMPVPAFVVPPKAVEAPFAAEAIGVTKSGETSSSIDLTTFDLKPAASARSGALDPTSAPELKQQKTAAKTKKVQKGTRQKIRELIARKRKKYGKYSKHKQPRRWIAKIFSVPEPLRFLGKQGSPEKMAAENELQPRVVSESAEGKGKPGNASSNKPFAELANKPATGSAKKPTKESTGRWLGKAPSSSRDPMSRELSGKELERKFETAVAQAFSENQKSNAANDNQTKSQWMDWHRPLTPKESKEEKASQEFERARKTANAYQPSNAPYEPELWKKGPVQKKDNSDFETDTFKLPDHGSPKSGWLGITSLASNKPSAILSEPTSENTAASEEAPPTEAPDEDEWTKKLRDLNENGTGTLKKGEAFMFSEDTGEAVLFLADGQKIRRIIANPVSSDELLKLRRPDVMVPKELYYDTSLLGKVVPPIPAPPPPAAASPNSVSPAPAFKMEDLVGGSNGFFGWLKGLVHL